MSQTGSQCAAIVVMAAGQGKRMRSTLPKVLHELSGQPLVFHILDKVLEASPNSPVAIVVGHGREKVEQAVRSQLRYSALSLDFIHQAEQKGTGHAAQTALASDWGQRQIASKRAFLVLPGDLPLIQTEMVHSLVQPLARGSAMRLLSTGCI